MSKRVKLFAIAILMLASVPAVADSGYHFGFSIVSMSNKIFLQAPPPDSTVCGFRLGLIRSLNESVCGLDIGVLVSETKEKFTGIGVSGLANVLDGPAKIYLLQVAGLANSTHSTKVLGFQIAGGVNTILEEGRVIGGQAAIVANFSPQANIYGFQLALYNRAAKVVGFQVGLVNVADELHGLQIGLVNINHSGAVPFLPVINFGF